MHDLRTLQSDHHSPADEEIIRYNVDHAEAVVVSWPHPYQQALELFPHASHKIALVPLPAFHPMIPTAASSTEPDLLLYPSSTAKHKNHANLLSAMSSLPGLRLVCPGPLVEPQASELRAQVSRESLEGRVIFPGFISKDELASLYRRASAVVVPSLWEAASGAIFEAFSWGLPVACADVPPLRSQVEFAGADVCFFDPSSPQSLAAAVARLLADRERFASASALAGAKLAERTWKQTASDYSAICEWVEAGSMGEIPQSAFADSFASNGE